MSCTILRTDILAHRSFTLSDAAWVQILAFVNGFQGFTCDPSLRKLALCLLGAHLAEVISESSATGATGPVISESAGGLKRTYAPGTTTASAAELSRTTFGQQFLGIAKFSVCTRGPFLV